MCITDRIGHRQMREKQYRYVTQQTVTELVTDSRRPTLSLGREAPIQASPLTAMSYIRSIRQAG